MTWPGPSESIGASMSVVTIATRLSSKSMRSRIAIVVGGTLLSLAACGAAEAGAAVQLTPAEGAQAGLALAPEEAGGTIIQPKSGTTVTATIRPKGCDPKFDGTIADCRFTIRSSGVGSSSAVTRVVPGKNQVTVESEVPAAAATDSTVSSRGEAPNAQCAGDGPCGTSVWDTALTSYLRYFTHDPS